MVLQALASIAEWGEVLHFVPVAAALAADRLLRTTAGAARVRAWGPRELGRVWLGALPWTAASMLPLAVLDLSWAPVCGTGVFAGLAVVGAVTARWLALHPKQADPGGTDLDASA